MDYGFEAIISTKFADIFYNNCFKNGLLPIILKEGDIQKIVSNIDEENNLFTVNLENQFISNRDFKIEFKIDKRRKKVLIEGIDDISETLKLSEKIKDYENNRAIKKPWIFNG